MPTYGEISWMAIFVLWTLQLTPAVSGASAVCPAATTVRYQRSQQLLLNESLSHCVKPLGRVRSAQTCLVKCGFMNAAAVVLSKADLQCFAVTLTPAAQPNNCGSVWNFSDPVTGHRIYLASNFLSRLASSFRAFIRPFTPSGTGAIGAVQSVQLPLSGCYLISAQSASGGSVTCQNTVLGNCNNQGGSGVRLTGTFWLPANIVLNVVVGQRGGDALNFAGAGGGGGTFVYSINAGTGPVLYLAAGGGGGATDGMNGGAGQVDSTNGANSIMATSGNSGDSGTGGTDGNGGTAKTSTGNKHGGCGAGWLAKSVSTRLDTNSGGQGGGLADGWTGGESGASFGGDNGAAGGFGGGGGGGGSSTTLLVGTLNTVGGASGAGGGYSGGGAGLSKLWAGGGGGTLCAGILCTASGSVNATSGWVLVSLVSLLACDG